jgi:hypothetical protein
MLLLVLESYVGIVAKWITFIGSVSDDTIALALEQSRVGGIENLFNTDYCTLKTLSIIQYFAKLALDGVDQSVGSLYVRGCVA